MTPAQKNEERACQVIEPLYRYARDCGIDPDVDMQNGLTDFLADLMHWCDLKEVKFDRALRRARTHFRTEKAKVGP